MNSHWPILVALILVASAGLYGFVVQAENEQRGKSPLDVRQLPSKYVSEPPATQTNTVYQIKTFAQEQSAPIASASAMHPAARTTAPGATLTHTERDTILVSLQATIEQRYARQASKTATGFSLAVPGVRIDVDRAAWSIALYNDNKTAPTVQSDGFVAMQNLLVANLEMDMNSPALPLPDGKISRRVTSKLGRLSLMTDPKLNNSLMIKPLVSKKPTPPPIPAPPGVNQNANAVHNGGIPTPPGVPAPARPSAQQVRPLPAPVAPIKPVKPPVNDQF